MADHPTLTQPPCATDGTVSDAAMILSEPQIVEITGGYKRAADQLAELRRQGFFRARASRLTGRVVLEREHYVAVCRGTVSTADVQPRPKVRLLVRPK